LKSDGRPFVGKGAVNVHTRSYPRATVFYCCVR
jgi:hypothetical protein